MSAHTSHRALRAFEAASRHGTLARAAEELAITQSAVSRHIRTLEEYFACRLFERRGRSLHLTDPARALLPGLSEGFDALERASAVLLADDEVLRLKAPSTLTMRWLLARLSHFRLANPDSEVQLTSAWMDVDKVDFRHEPFDCAVLLSDGQFPDEWESVLLFEEWLIPVCAAGDSEAGPWSLARLRAAEQLHPTPDRRDWRRWLQATGLIEQVPLKTGRRVDIMALDKKGQTTVVEVKSSLEDYASDSKWGEYLPFCDRFYFAVPTDFPIDILHPSRAGLRGRRS